MLEKLEHELDSFCPDTRKQALDQIAAGLKKGILTTEPAGDYVNLHAHTFFSFNCYDYSPSKYAWLAKQAGLAVAGIVDFDVFDGIDEFLDAAGALNLKACASIETRVFVPEFSDKEINSPGEPGIAYHMGTGIPFGTVEGPAGAFLDNLKQTAQNRNRSMMDRINPFLAPVTLDFETDVLPLTPAHNPTERHICLAFARKAIEYFAGEEASILNYWQNKLGAALTPEDMPESPKLLNAVRSKTMKQGGVGYVKPNAGAFPTMQQMNEFVLQAGGIPTIAWLNGLTEGEKQIEKLIDIAVSTGVAAFNIIPDRNFTPGVKDEKLAALQHVVEICRQRDLPILVGTEMNSFGQKFRDSFEAEELKPMLGLFLAGAHILYAHTALHRRAGMGYLSDWAKAAFSDIKQKNVFYETVGKTLEPKKLSRLEISPKMEPKKIIETINNL